MWKWQYGKLDVPRKGDCGVARFVNNPESADFPEVVMRDCDSNIPFICMNDGIDVSLTTGITCSNHILHTTINETS